MPGSFTHISYKDISNRLIEDQPVKELQCVIIIPAFAEKSLKPVIQSLHQMHDLSSSVEVIVLINESEGADPLYKEINRRSYQEMQIYDLPELRVHTLYITDIPVKFAGVGLARKLAMDEAVKRLQSVGNTQNGIIVNLDADCTVSTNYLREIQQYFQKHTTVELCSIHWEHDLSLCTSEDERTAIISYECHLRYFIGMQRFLKLPYAFQTMGSAFAVRPLPYLQIGGMNRRKAGEDFYFIHKFTKKNAVGDLNTCTVYPSPRQSFRVPFGTGKAITDQLGKGSFFATYHPQSFFDLLPFVGDVTIWYHSSDALSALPESVRAYLAKQNFAAVLEKIRSNSKSEYTFRKAFFQWFDAFRLMKYLHHTRENYYPDMPILSALNHSLTVWNAASNMHLSEWLIFLQHQHKEGAYIPFE